MKRSNPKVFIYLASQSARRADLLKRQKIPFQAVPSPFRETHRRKESPQKTVLRNAFGKAFRAKLPAHRPSKARSRQVRILGADTVVYFRGKALGKPRHYKEAVRTLSAMGGKSHQVYTGLVLLSPDHKKVLRGWAVTKVVMKRWDNARIKDYVVKIHALDKAGSYAIQEKPCIAAAYQGSFSNVVGLPRELLGKLLAQTFCKEPT